MRRTRMVVVVGVVGVAVAAIVGVRWWRWAATHARTDDAYVAAHTALVTPRIDGTIASLEVEDNWQVSEGDLLVRLDRTDREIALRNAKAALATAVLHVDELRDQVQAAEREAELAQAELALAERDAGRTEELFRKKIVSIQDVDRSRTDLRVARARLAAAQAEVSRARAELGIPPGAPAERAPTVRQARAARDQAALMLSWTELRAPIAGIVATRSVQLGQHVVPGQVLLRIVPLAGAYVEANFKETQIGALRVGQPAEIVADAYPGHVYRGVVESLAPGTGAAFALLPPENATGNWIKIVQRLPVKIRIVAPAPSERPLRVGMSVEATVDVAAPDGSLLVPLSQSEAREGAARVAGTTP
jgi:membrane fusion protein (multidrug efflux system)